ncbi:MAG: hypothetical protein C0428_09660 [Polaromonas sp.]|nr:hypothetical protein [Polaromonas sp.]
MLHKVMTILKALRPAAPEALHKPQACIWWAMPGLQVGIYPAKTAVLASSAGAAQQRSVAASL